MQQLWTIYHHNIPDFIYEFAQTTPMLRLKNIGMNCGCEYTKFPTFQNCQPYSRYDHSIGVALIIWHFTHNQIQTIAGLFHDIATPVFAHTIDFFNGDYETQESTEENTKQIITSSQEIMSLTEKYHIDVSQIIDYHIYPIADNNSPQLSADRLEYTLANMLNYGFCPIEPIKTFYNDLTIGLNEQGIEELSFQTTDIAIAFSQMSIKTSYVYIADEDRFSMQALADIIHYAINHHILTKQDLYKDEPYVIQKLCSNSSTKHMWLTFIQYSQIKKSSQKPSHGYWLQVNAKKRYINPLIINKKRVTHVSPKINALIQEFIQTQLNDYISASYSHVIH